jgi:hypothetical protein
MDFRHAGFATAVIALLLTGCSTWHIPADDPELRLAVTRSSVYDPARANFFHAIIPGTVKDASGSLLRDFGEEFRDGLKASLYINELLAIDATDARYRVDLEVNFTASGVFERQVDTTVHYRVVALSSNETVIDKTIQSSDTQAWEGRGPVAAILLDRPIDVATNGQRVHFNSERNNIEMFFQELSHWKPPPSTGASPR